MFIVTSQQGSCYSFYGYGSSWFSQSELPLLLILSCLKNTGNINDMHSQSEIRQPCFLIFLLKKKNAVRSNCMHVSGGSFVMSIHMRVAGKCFTVLFLRKNNKQQCLIIPNSRSLQLSIPSKLEVGKLSLDQMSDLFVLQSNNQMVYFSNILNKMFCIIFILIGRE